jgi:hypothetical protein
MDIRDVHSSEIPKYLSGKDETPAALVKFLEVILVYFDMKTRGELVSD